MFLPLRDTPNEGGVPVVNYALIAINVVIFLFVSWPLMGATPDMTSAALRDYYAAGGNPLAASAYDVVVFQHGFRPANPTLASLLSSMFLHGSFMHLAGNMLFLWIYGDNVEAWLGRAGYLVAYLLCGVAATGLHSVFDLSSNIPMIGASGAISGVLGFYFVFFPKNRVSVLIVLFPFFYDVIQIPARIVLGAYLVLDNLVPILLNGMEGSIAHGAHIGGFLGGLGAAFALRGSLSQGRGGGRVIDMQSRRPVHPEQPTASAGPRPEGPRPTGSRPTGSRPTGSGAARQMGKLIARDQFSEAAQIYFSLPEGTDEEPAPDDALRLGHWLAESGHPTAALTVFERVLRRQPDQETAAWAHLGAGMVQYRALDRTTAAYQHFLDVIDLVPSSAAAEQARAVVREIDAR